MKIAIYTPFLNEEKHAAAWADSCAEADYRVTINTGATDNTAQILKDKGVHVHDVLISPWRFDLAYNVAMALIPADADVCICLHMDERLEAGWREKLEAAWTPQTTRLRYTYVWSWAAPGVPGRTWSGDRIHARKGFMWMGATHEGLCSRLPETQTYCKDLRILHFMDAKSKKGDLILLEEAVREAPHDARMRAYLGREYMYQGMKDKCIETYKEFLTMPCWNVERGLAMQHLANVDTENKVYWLKSAALETPNHREPLVELARHYYGVADWQNTYKYAKKALQITVHPMDYSCSDEAWGWLPHDLAAIGAWNLALRQESVTHARDALKHKPDDQRLQNNLKVIERWFTENQVPLPPSE